MAMRAYAAGVTVNCGRMRGKMLVIEMLPHLKILQKQTSCVAKYQPNHCTLP